MGLASNQKIVADDCPEMRKFLKVVPKMLPKMLRDNPIILPPEMVIFTEADKKRGYTTQEGAFRVTRIRQAIQFAESERTFG